MLPWEMESCGRGVDVGLAHGGMAVRRDSPAPVLLVDRRCCRALVEQWWQEICAFYGGTAPNKPALPLGQSTPGALPPPWAAAETQGLTRARRLLRGEGRCVSSLPWTH